MIKEATNKKISIGFCSQKPDYNFIKHLNNIFGKRKIDVINKTANDENRKTISQAYNEIIRESKNDIIVLCHNDIIFLNNDLADVVDLLFTANYEYGIIGLVGGTSVSATPPIDWCGFNRKKYGRWIQGYKFQKKGDDYFKLSMHEKTQLKDVIVCDGLLLMINRTKIKKLFDETNQTFHFYDLDFCLANYLEGVKVGVTTDILVRHDSEGNYDAHDFKYQESMFLKKFKDVLPIEIK